MRSRISLAVTALVAFSVLMLMRMSSVHVQAAKLGKQESELLKTVRGGLVAIADLAQVVGFSEDVSSESQLQMYELAMKAMSMNMFGKMMHAFSIYLADLRRDTDFYGAAYEGLRNESAQVRQKTKQIFEQSYLKSKYIQLESEEVPAYFDKIKEKAMDMLKKIKFCPDCYTSDLKKVADNHAALVKNIEILETNKFFPLRAHPAVEDLIEQRWFQIRGSLPKVDRGAVEGLGALLHEAERILAKKKTPGWENILRSLIHDQIPDHVAANRESLSLIFPITKVHLDQFEERIRTLASHMAPELLHKTFKNLCDLLDIQIEKFTAVKLQTESEYKKQFDWEPLAALRPIEIEENFGTENEQNLGAQLKVITVIVAAIVAVLTIIFWYCG